MIASVLLLVLASPCALAHMRILSPEPRNDAYNIKSGPCGDETGDFTGTVTDVSPGTYTLTVQESIHHREAPYRVALSRVEDDTYDCILLDHIPQHTTGTSSTLYIDVEIPNVDCNPCALQVISFMTDKTDDGSCCEYQTDGTSGSCFSNYHSCANINILSDPDASDYIADRNDLVCTQPEGWPYRDWATAVYTQESSTDMWTAVDGEDDTLQLVIDGSTETNPCSSLTLADESETEESNNSGGGSSDDGGDPAVDALLAVVLVLGLIGLIVGGGIVYAKYGNKNSAKSELEEPQIAAGIDNNQTNIVPTTA